MLQKIKSRITLDFTTLDIMCKYSNKPCAEKWGSRFPCCPYPFIYRPASHTSLRKLPV